MLIEKEKQKIIAFINKNYRTLLSYGKNTLMPMGEFIVTDIQEDEIPEEYLIEDSKIDMTRLILTKIDDENVKITIPITTFLEKYIKVAEKNLTTL